jgi:hypothetical protein
MDFDKWRREKREIENLDSCYLNFEERIRSFSAGRSPSGLPRNGAKKTKTRMHHIDLIDWTSAINQLSVDYAKPHLQLLCISGVQISLDAFPGSNPEI